MLINTDTIIGFNSQGFRCWDCSVFIVKGNEHVGNFCDTTCQQNYKDTKLHEEWQNGLYTWSPKEKAPSWIYNYLLESRGRNCERCGIHTWNGVPVKLRVDQINNTDDVTESNLVLVCPNCKKHK